MSLITACKPRDEVLEGELDDAIFAASLNDLVSGTAKPVYGDPHVFFQNTHPAAQLKRISRRVFSHLKDPNQGGAFIRLSTGFGGGKTHALMALWHLATNAADDTVGVEVVPVEERPSQVTVVAVDVGAAGIPNFGQHSLQTAEVVTTHSLWGEVAFCLAGKVGLEGLGDGEAADRQPNLDEFEKLFPAGPVLILLDELVIYMANLREGEQNALLNFVNKLINICTRRPQTVLVISDPAAQAVYASQTQRLERAMAAQDIDQITGRTATDVDPIGAESAKVIVRRLFASVDGSAAGEVADSYHSLYQRLASEPGGHLIPEEVAREEYRHRLIENYPFHPRLMQTARDRLTTIPEFNSSRGTLRLFSRIIRNVFEREDPVDLITAGEIDWSDAAIRNELLSRLNRDGFNGAVNTDIEQHAKELDGGARGIHTRAASALLTESLTLEANAGLDERELTLAVLRPEEAGPEAVEAMERLRSQCWYTYTLDSGRGYQFRVEPNVNQMIAQRAPTVSQADALARVHAEVQTYFQGPVFRVVPWPENPRQVPDNARLHLALCDSLDAARNMASLADEQADLPRQNRNAIVAIAPATDPYEGAEAIARRLIAAEGIRAEHQTGESGRKVLTQIEPIITNLRRELGIQARRAFSNVVLADKQVRPIEEQYQVPADRILSGNLGQTNLKDYLEAKNLIYRPGDSLDTDLFMDRVVSGATPNTQTSGTWTAKAIHERLLSHPSMRLVPDEGVTRRSIMKAVAEGRLVVLTSDGTAYDAEGAVSGAALDRRRMPGATLAPAIPLDEGVLVARPNEPVALSWLEVSVGDQNGEEEPGPGPGGPRISDGGPPPPPAGPTRTTSWTEAKELATQRSLKALVLIARTPPAAATLAALAAPLGANRLSLTVQCLGTGRSNGGTFRLMIEEAPHNHPSNPIAMASTIYNSLEEAGRQFQVRLSLNFGTGRAGMAAGLEQAANASAEGVTMEAEFAPPVDGAVTQQPFSL